ncbi:MAG: type II secretion system protein [Azonexus sp.]|nr:type II secretion system protein [Azonexus sp.]
MIYLALLLSIALIGGLSAVGLKVAQTVQLRNAEADLLGIGVEFRNALQSYAEVTPNGLPPTPDSLNELLRDPRFPGMRRHLRRIYHDPLTGKAEWGIIRGPDRRIVGIHSLSSGACFKLENFPAGLESLSGTTRHSDWVFSLASIPVPVAR